MPVYKISGGHKLQGEVHVSGAKNAALPILAATLLTDKEITLSHIPHIKDIEYLSHCLKKLGKVISHENHLFHCHSKASDISIPEIFARQIRGSIVLLGPLIALHARVILPLPGGCSIGKRPIDQHILALASFGVSVTQHTDHLVCERPPGRLRAGTVRFSVKTVTGTENAIMAAVLADGDSVIYHAAIEPEVLDLIHFLNMLGACIRLHGTDTIEVTGVERLGGCQNYEIIGDRIEAGTYLVAAAMTHGRITIKGVAPETLQLPLNILRHLGIKLSWEADSIEIDATDSPQQIQPLHITTSPFPGFPTDLQSLFLSLATQLNVESTISETIFENRFQVVHELKRMGANITIQSENTVVVARASNLRGACVNATDLRSGAALICAGLAAEGNTYIAHTEHIERGYEGLLEKLKRLGAEISIVPHSSLSFFTPDLPSPTSDRAMDVKKNN